MTRYLQISEKKFKIKDEFYDKFSFFLEGTENENVFTIRSKSIENIVLNAMEKSEK